MGPLDEASPSDPQESCGIHLRLIFDQDVPLWREEYRQPAYIPTARRPGWAHRLVEGEESNQSLDRRKVMQGDTLDL
jgi:hypothetical protein